MKTWRAERDQASQALKRRALEQSVKTEDE